MILFLYGERQEVQQIKEMPVWKERDFTDIQTAYSERYAEEISNLSIKQSLKRERMPEKSSIRFFMQRRKIRQICELIAMSSVLQIEGV